MNIETNKFKRAWIWVWYSETTRILVLTGLPALLITMAMGATFGSGEYLRVIAGFSYAFLFGWGVIDNDFSNLRRIGLDEYRNKIKGDL